MPEVNPSAMMAVLVFLILVVLLFGKKRGGFSGGRVGNGHLLTEKDLKKTTQKAEEHNSTQTELNNFVAYMLRFAKKHKMCLAVPGNVLVDGKKSNAAMILVGPHGALGIHCYGFGGSVGPADSGYDWQQTINGQTKAILNPLQMMGESSEVLRSALEKGGYKNLPVYCAAVFTQTQVQLHADGSSNVYNVHDFKDWLESDPLPAAPVKVEALKTAQYLSGLCPKPAEKTK